MARGSPSRRSGSAITGNASSVFGAAFEAARERVGGQASELVQQAKENSREFLKERKGLLANELGNVSGAIRRAADKLEDSDNAMLAGYIDTAANRLEDVSRYIESHDLRDLAARRQGLTPDDLGRKVKRVATRARDAMTS